MILSVRNIYFAQVSIDNFKIARASMSIYHRRALDKDVQYAKHSSTRYAPKAKISTRDEEVYSTYYRFQFASME